jgi:pyruvate formate lyase activating enzyme
MKGILFDIKEFALNDGSGIRTTVFMKGCPLRCRWCHNPEGLSSAPQRIVTQNSRRMAGTEYEASSLAAVLKKNSDVFEETGGGVTFSGGEPLYQADFVGDVIRHLEGIHILLDTSGYAGSDAFVKVASKVQHVYYDLKLMDSREHLLWTGKDNQLILRNILILDKMDVPYTLRVPLIPSVTDSVQNLTKIADFARDLEHPVELNLLPYNALAGAKYESIGMQYLIDFNAVSAVRSLPEDIFKGLKIPVKLLSAGHSVYSRTANKTAGA